MLSNERRLRVVLALRDCPGGSSASVMSPILDIPEAQLTDLLSELASVGLCRKGRAGRYMLYQINQELLDKLAQLIHEEPQL